MVHIFNLHFICTEVILVQGIDRVGRVCSNHSVVFLFGRLHAHTSLILSTAQMYVTLKVLFLVISLAQSH